MNEDYLSTIFFYIFFIQIDKTLFNIIFNNIHFFNGQNLYGFQ